MREYMPPWDSAVYFDLPKMVSVALVAGVTTQLITADPRRAWICVSITNDPVIVRANYNLAFIGFDNLVSITRGILLNQDLPPREFNLASHGPIVQSEFWAVMPAGGTLSVTTLNLHGWPNQRRHRASIPRPLPSEPNGNRGAQYWNPDRRA